MLVKNTSNFKLKVESSIVRDYGIILFFKKYFLVIIHIQNSHRVFGKSTKQVLSP